MNKTLLNIWIMVMVPVVYISNNLILKQILTGPMGIFAKNHLNDLMAPLFLLAYSNFLLNFKGKQLVKLSHILVFVGVAGFVWEYVAPLFKPSSVSDIYDLMFYIIGGTLYWIFLKLTK